MRITTGVFAGCALMACAHGTSKPGGNDGSGDDAPPMATLSIEPAMTELVVQNGVPAQAAFKAILTAADGSQQDVTAQSRFDIDDNFGQFTGNVLSISVADKTQIRASFQSTSAAASLTVRVATTRFESGLPPTTAALFTGITDDPTASPLLVYPPAGAIMPRNVGDFDIHWTDGHSHDVFEVSLHTELSDVFVYVKGGNGGAPPSPTAFFQVFSAAELLAAVGSQPSVSFQVRGASTSAAAPTGGTAMQAVQLSNETMLGLMYYWSTAAADNTIGIFQHDMASPSDTATPFITAGPNDRCVACHVLSRDGTMMAVTYQSGAAPGPANLLTVMGKAFETEANQWNFGTFTVDDKQFLAVEHGVLVVRDAKTQAVLTTMTTTPAGEWVTQPELSPDGKQLVYVRAGLSGTDLDFKQGQIWVRSYDAATMTFGMERPLVNDGMNNFFPSWSPDSQWIAFNRTDAADDSYDDNNSATYAIKADGSAPEIELAEANLARGLTNSAVRWAPYAQTLGPDRTPMFWLTISSKRDFGVRLINTGLAQRGTGGKRAQIWMTPFFPALAAQGKDPSAPAFRLPFQHVDSSNQTAQWTQPPDTLQ